MSWLISAIGEVGGILLAAGLIGSLFEYAVRRTQLDLIHTVAGDLVRKILHEEAGAIKDAVVNGFAIHPEDLKRVATPELLDTIAANAMALRLGDEQFAREIYTSIRDQTIRASERWLDVDVNMRLSTMVERSAEGAPLLDVTVTVEYTTVPSHPVRRFVCTSDKDEHNELRHDRPATSAWHMTPRPGMDASSRENFELLSFAVDGAERARLRPTGTQSATRRSGLEQELYDLQKTYTKGTLDDDFFIAEKQKLIGGIERARIELTEVKNGGPERQTLRAMTAFRFAARAMHSFHRADLTTKRAILQSLDAAPVLRDRRLSLELATWLTPLATTPSRAITSSLDSAMFAIAETQTGHGVRTAALDDSPLLLRRIVAVIAHWYRVASDVRSAVANVPDASALEFSLGEQREWWESIRGSKAKDVLPPPRALKDRLSGRDMERLVALHREGASCRELQEQFEIGRTSVKKILRQSRQGLLM